MEKLQKILRLSVLVFMMILASVGMSISGAAPVIPKHKETVMEDEVMTKKDKETEDSTSSLEQKEKQ